ncbi:hypothetical protein CROQUDRAFT_698630, partial [Cronartium quercuum f. sp. fusiforme G11]
MEHPAYPDPPNNDQLICLQPLTKESILNNKTVFTTYSSVNHPNKTDWTPFKALLHADLANNKISGEFTFDWDAEDGKNICWNKIMILFIVKHWTFAKMASAFFKYALDMKWNQENIHIHCQHIFIARKLAMKSRTIFDFPRETLQLYLSNFIDLLLSANCSSDTEINPDQAIQHSIHPKWQSEKYGNWLHQVDQLSFKNQSTVMGQPLATRRFDTHFQAGNTIPWPKFVPSSQKTVM